MVGGINKELTLSDGNQCMAKRKKKTLPALKKKAWSLLSKCIRQSSADSKGMVSCYTCGNSGNWKEMQAGHGIGGRTNSVLFDKEIIRVQCVSCNIFKSGNYTIFTTKLIKENGMEWWENKLTNSRVLVKYTRADLEELIERLTRASPQIDPGTSPAEKLLRRGE